MARIFVFGSNLKGIHGAGAALFAKNHAGAIQGQGEGLQGQSYAIPTKRTPWERMTISEVKLHVDRFIVFATEHREMQFLITRVGCGRAGFTEDQMAKLFSTAPSNCVFDDQWECDPRIA